ncbi:hypothetical protein ACSBR2_030877 [Camellia fascicularis]
MAARGKYARVCVEMDLRKPLISYLTIGRYHYVVEYEHLNLLCFACGRVGHRKEKCPDFSMIQPEKKIPNMTVTQTGTEVGSREKQPNGQVNKELSMEPETHGYGPWTLVTTRRKHQYGKQKQKHHVYKSNRFESLQTKQDQGETSKAQDIIPDQRNYVDLDMAPQAIKEDLSYVHTQSPHGTNEHMKDVGAISRMDGVTGPKEKEMICCVSPQSTNTTGPQTSPDGSNAQGNPIANPAITAALTESNSNVLNTVIAPVICVPNSNVRSPDFSTSKEEHFNGGHGREPPTVQAPSGSIPSPDVLRTRERSVSPHRHRLVARRGEAADSTLVGDRFTHREAYGACETHEDAGGRPEECAKSFGGAGNARFRRNLRELVRLHQPDMMVLMETKVEISSMGMFFNNLGYTASTHVDPIGRSGGIWLLWNPSQLNVRVQNASSQIITATISRQDYPDWVLSAIYASPNIRLRDELWNDFAADKRSFSSATSQNLSQSQRKSQKFSDRISSCNLMDLGCVGPRLTWTNNRKEWANTMVRLDRALCNTEWRTLFPEGYVRNLPRTYSDHSPLLIHTQGTNPSSPPCNVFKFQAAWLSHEDFSTVIENNWPRQNNNLLGNLDFMTSALQD